MIEITICDLKMKTPKNAILLRMPKRDATSPIAVESRILFLRHQRVILDADLAELYGVPVRVLNQQIKRNRERFPSDFLFHLTAKEHEILRSQFVISSHKHGGRRYTPNAFTEHGAIMAATVLNSKRAVQMSVFVVRAFVRLREMLATNRRLAGKIDELENRLNSHDSSIVGLFTTIKGMMTPKRKPGPRIGFQLPEANAKAQISPKLLRRR
jgi:ORF6N domain-containing protein